MIAARYWFEVGERRHKHIIYVGVALKHINIVSRQLPWKVGSLIGGFCLLLRAGNLNCLQSSDLYRFLHEG